MAIKFVPKVNETSVPKNDHMSNASLPLIARKFANRFRCLSEVLIKLTQAWIDVWSIAMEK